MLCVCVRMFVSVDCVTFDCTRVCVCVCVCGCVRACVCVNTSIIRYMACIILKISNEVLFFFRFLFFWYSTPCTVSYYFDGIFSFYITEMERWILMIVKC